MPRLSFKMKLFPGYGEEYKKRHDQIWPELKELLQKTGISNYSIFLNEENGDLFAVFDIDDPQKLDNLRQEEEMKRWWDGLVGIMETNPDKSPVALPLKQVFFLP